MSALTAPSFTGSAGSTTAHAEAALANLALSRIAAPLIADDTEDTPSARHARAVFGPTRDEILRDFPFPFAVRRIKLVETEYYGSGAFEYAFSLPSSPKILRVLEVYNDPLEPYESLNGTVLANVESGEEYDAETVTVDHANEKFTVANIEYYPDGLPVLLGGTAAPTGLTLGTTYYVRDGDEDANTFKLAATPGGAVLAITTAGTDVTLQALGNLDARVVIQETDTTAWDSLFKEAFVLRLASKLAYALLKDLSLSAALQGEFAALLSLAKVAASSERQIEEQSGEDYWTER